jgi:hypothetical protein
MYNSGQLRLGRNHNTLPRASLHRGNPTPMAGLQSSFADDMTPRGVTGESPHRKILGQLRLPQIIVFLHNTLPRASLHRDNPTPAAGMTGLPTTLMIRVKIIRSVKAQPAKYDSTPAAPQPEPQYFYTTLCCGYGILPFCTPARRPNLYPGNYPAQGPYIPALYRPV